MCAALRNIYLTYFIPAIPDRTRVMTASNNAASTCPFSLANTADFILSFNAPSVDGEFDSLEYAA